MHPVVIPKLFPGASASLCTLQQGLIEASHALAKRWNSIVGEPSEFDLLQNLEIETGLRVQLASFLKQLDDELSQALLAAHQRIRELKHALQHSLASDLNAEHEKAADDLRLMIMFAKDNIEVAEENQLEIADLHRRIHYLLNPQPHSP